MKRILESPLFFFGWLLLCGFASISLLNDAHQGLQGKQRLLSLANENARLRTANQTLQHQIQDAQDPAVQEKRIRDELGYQLPGETIVQLQRSPLATPSPASGLVTSLPMPKAPILQWWQLFFGQE